LKLFFSKTFVRKQLDAFDQHGDRDFIHIESTLLIVIKIEHQLFQMFIQCFPLFIQ